ncbi:MAG: hypothetical protein AB7O50_00815 [Pseudolabrys sp.]
MPPRLFTSDSVTRLRVTPDADEPFAQTGPRPRGPQGQSGKVQASRRPHSDATVARVRRLVVETTLTYGEIAARTGVGRASICRWTRDGAWKRPPFAPRATDTVPRARAGQRLKLRLLAERLRALCERHISALEAAPGTTTAALLAALALVQAAKLEAIGRRGRRRLVTSDSLISDATYREVARKALAELDNCGVDTAHLPGEALSLIVDARMPAEENRAFRRRGS